MMRKHSVHRKKSSLASNKKKSIIKLDNMKPEDIAKREELEAKEKEFTDAILMIQRFERARSARAAILSGEKEFLCFSPIFYYRDV